MKAARFEAEFKRCERCRKNGFVSEQSSTHKAPDIVLVLFSLTRGTESSLSEDDRGDPQGVYEERQCQR